MAGKSHELTARVVLQGRVDNTFTQIGTQLQSLGEQLLRTNRWVINFGKESLDTYINFDDAMLDAYAAMQSNYKDSAKLESDYAAMRQKAYERAANSTRFTTLDVASAYAVAAHAGKDFAEADYLVAAAIDYAVAGHMDLATAMDSLIVIMNSAGIAMEDAGTVVDQLVYGGNNAATTVEELTSAMVRTGPSLKFFNGDMAAATAMMGVLADNGMKDVQAGTMMRSTMLRLVAPTDKATKAMDALSASEEEVTEAGAISADTLATLNENGFSVFDDYGNLKPMIQIWTELAGIVSGMNQEDAFKLISDIFPTRQFNSALAFVEEAEKMVELYGELSDPSVIGGYAANAAATMESGFGGSMRRIDAKVDTFKTKLGGVIADDLAAPAEMAANALDWLLDIDEGKLGAVTGFFETLIGGAGALTVAGTGMKIIGTALGALPGGKIVLAAVGVSALAVGVTKLIQASEDEKFGDMTLDMGMFTDTLSGLTSALDGKYADVKLYNDEIDRLITNYTTMSTNLSTGMWDALFNGETWNDEQWKESEQAAISAVEGMADAGKDMVKVNYDMVNGVVGYKVANDNTGLWARVQGYIDAGYETALADVTRKGNAVRKAVVEAWSDGQLTDEEVAYIQSTMDDYNKALDEYNDVRNQGKLAAKLHDAQTVSVDTVQEFYDAIDEARDSSLDLTDSVFYDELGYAVIGGAPQEDIDAMFDWRDAERMAKNAEYGRKYLDIYKTALLTSDMNSGGYKNIADFLAADDGDAFKFTDKLIRELGNGKAWQGMEVLRYMAENGDLSAKAIYEYAMREGGKEDGMIGMLYNAAPEISLNKSGFLFGTGQSVFSSMSEEDMNRALWGYETEPGTSINTKLDVDTSEYDAWKEKVEGTGLNIPVSLTIQNGVTVGGGDDKPNYKKGVFAEGGRADVASIFGEAGPEWAIPEEHSSRTAELLRMAAAASGFTWSELLSARGGLNAGSGSASTVVYSPTIYANDAKGLRDELIADKSRLEKWWRERELREELTAYA